MNQTTAVRQYLIELGLAPEEAAVYLELAKNTAPSVMMLSASVGISRTQVYRHLARLQEFNLVNKSYYNGSAHYQAMPLDNLEDILFERRQRLQQNISKLGDMSRLVNELSDSRNLKSAVRHHYGLQGIRQANWNLTRARGEYRVFEVAALSEHLNEEFENRVHEELDRNRVSSFDIVNRREVRKEGGVAGNPARMHYCYIDPSILSVAHEIYIYNDTVTLLDYHRDNMHAIEIEHPMLSRIMGQIHKTIWGIGTELTLIRDQDGSIWR